VEIDACIEIGAYPCRYLGIFGELGYELNGIDTTEKIESDELKNWMVKNNWNFNILEKINFLKFDTKYTFNIVCSFGFIEHFKNWPEIIIKHTKLLKIGGYLIIETPNFAGFFQRVFHILVDYENYKRHVIGSMNPKKWAAVLEKDYEIIYAGYFGKFSFWYENSKLNIIQKAIIKCFSIMGRILKKMPYCRLYSPYCGLIAKKLS
jgi:SAM-dependent methyltransferase